MMKNDVYGGIDHEYSIESIAKGNHRRSTRCFVFSVFSHVMSYTYVAATRACSLPAYDDCHWIASSQSSPNTSLVNRKNVKFLIQAFSTRWKIGFLSIVGCRRFARCLLWLLPRYPSFFTMNFPQLQHWVHSTGRCLYGEK